LGLCCIVMFCFACKPGVQEEVLPGKDKLANGPLWAPGIWPCCVGSWVPHVQEAARMETEPSSEPSCSVSEARLVTQEP
jgi:hypothetical protein